MKLSVLVLLGVGAVAVTLGASSVGSGEPGRFSQIPVMPLAAEHSERCRESGFLRPVCVRVVPQITGYASALYVEPGLDVFDLGRGAESPRHPERNRPPSMLHVVAAGGDVNRLTPFQDPIGGRGAQLQDGLMSRDRTRPVSFGKVRWASRVGVLYLAPPFASGGMLGNHLVFAWTEIDRRYVVSLHAWEPLTESVDTLRKMVEQLPNAREASQLNRLTTLTRLRLEKGWARTAIPVRVATAVDSLTLRIVSRQRTNLAVSVRPPFASPMPNHVTSDSRHCRTRPPYRLCLTRATFSRPIAPGRWVIQVTKRSQPPADNVRIDLLLAS